MAAITAAAVNALRATTGVGMMDCKKALTETNGDVEAAIKLLRERGVAVAAKRASKEAKQGIVAAKASADGKTLALVEVNCETDFVARNSDFVAFVDTVAEAAVANEKDVAEVMAEAITQKSATIGEKMVIRRSVRYTLEGCGLLASYIHMGGKVGVALELGFGKAETAALPEVVELANNLCLQVAAAAPRYLKREDVPEAEVDEEMKIQVAALKNDEKNANKPENILQNIVKGRMGKFYGEICLAEQEYVKDVSGKQKVQAVIDAAAKAAGDTIVVRRFTRYQLGA